MSFEKPQIRRALLSDATSLTECIQAAYAKYVGQIDDLPPVSEGVALDIAELQVWVASIGDDVIAGLILSPKPQYLKIVNLAVHPDHGGKGIGRRLLELADNEAKRQNYNELRLRTHIKMTDNVGMYKHFGWRVMAKDLNIISMKKSIL